MMFLILAALSAVTLGQDTYYCPDGWVVSEIGGLGDAGMQWESQWWIGAHVHGPHGDHNFGNWTWDHNGAEVSWFDWMRNEPNDWHRQNCLTFLKDQDIFGFGAYHWNDWDCNQMARFICEKPPHEY